MDIPDSAIDAASRAIAQFDPEWGTPANVPPSVVDRCAARAALEAAAPYITAQALRDAALIIDRGYSAAYHHGDGDLSLWKKLHESSYWLRDRADKLDT